MNESARCTESLSSPRPLAHIANPRPLVQHPVLHPSITGVEQQKHGLGSALKSTHAKIFLSDQPLHGSGQGGLGDNRCSISCKSKGVDWNISVLFSSSVSEYCVTAMNLYLVLDKKVWITVIGIRSATHFPPFFQLPLLRTHSFFTQPAMPICTKWYWPILRRAQYVLRKLVQSP